MAWQMYKKMYDLTLVSLVGIYDPCWSSRRHTISINRLKQHVDNVIRELHLRLRRNFFVLGKDVGCRTSEDYFDDAQGHHSEVALILWNFDVAWIPAYVCWMQSYHS